MDIRNILNSQNILILEFEYTILLTTPSGFLKKYVEAYAIQHNENATI